MNVVDDKTENMKMMIENDFDAFLYTKDSYELADLIFSCVDEDTFYKIINTINNNM